MSNDPDAITLSEVAIYSPHRDGVIDDRLHRMVDALKATGCIMFKSTRVDGGLWVEGWRHREVRIGEFNSIHAERVQVEMPASVAFLAPSESREPNSPWWV